MPTTQYESIEKAWQALTEVDIETGEDDMPVAVIKATGIFFFMRIPYTIRIAMVSLWDLSHVLEPLRNRVLGYYGNMLLAAKQSQTVTTEAMVEMAERIKIFQQDICDIYKSGDKQKIERVSQIFNNEFVSREFFSAMKKMGVLPFWLTYKSFARGITPSAMLVIFAFLWAFTFDGVKKNAELLLRKMGSVIDFHLPTLPIAFETKDISQGTKREEFSRFLGALRHSKN